VSCGISAEMIGGDPRIISHGSPDFSRFSLTVMAFANQPRGRPVRIYLPAVQPQISAGKGPILGTKAGGRVVAVAKATNSGLPAVPSLVVEPTPPRALRPEPPSDFEDEELISAFGLPRMTSKPPVIVPAKSLKRSLAFPSQVAVEPFLPPIAPAVEPVVASKKRARVPNVVKRPRKLTAWQWNHIIPRYDTLNRIVGGECKVCKVYIDDPTGAGPHKYDKHIMDHEARNELVCPLKDEPRNCDVALTPAETEALNKALAAATVTGHWPLSLCETDAFTQLMESVNPAWKLPGRHKLVDKYLEPLFNVLNLDVFTRMRLEEDCHFSVYVDVWKAGKASGSNLHRSFLGIVFSAVDRQWRPHVAALAVRRVKGHHSIPAILETLMQVLTVEYGISVQKIAGVASDNHNTECGVLGKVVERTGGLALQVHCFPHTLHLAVTDGLDNVPEATEILGAAHEVVALFAERRLLSERLASLVQGYNSSHEAARLPLTLVMDVDTRWNSAFDMLKCLYKLHVLVLQAMRDERSSLGTSQSKAACSARDKLTALINRLTVAAIDMPFLIEVLEVCKIANDATEGDHAYVSRLPRIVDYLEYQLSVS
jgi:hypothetical protein